MGHTVICIGREFGSGGHEIARRTGSRLGIPVYDEEMLTLACGLGDVREELLRSEDERPVNPFLFRTMHEGNEKVSRTMPAGHVLYDLQAIVMRRLVKEGDCIIVGRCADHILNSEDAELLTVFIHAPLEQRIQRKMELESLPYAKVKKQVEKKDRQRRKYYESHTGMEWGSADHYDLMIDTGQMTLDEAADRIAEAYKCSKKPLSES